MATWAQVLKSFDKQLDHREIDEFLRHLNKSVNSHIRELEKEIKNQSPDKVEDPRDLNDYRDYLEERIMYLYATKVLGDELSIIALYKKIEIHTNRIIKRKFPTRDAKKLSDIKYLKDKLQLDIKTVEGYSSLNELRLINNSIKHEGKVSAELAKQFPSWKEGAKLSDLDLSYKRLLPGVNQYVKDLVEKLYAIK
jgi:soluble cytochrome b562